MRGHDALGEGIGRRRNRRVRWAVVALVGITAVIGVAGYVVLSMVTSVTTSTTSSCSPPSSSFCHNDTQPHDVRTVRSNFAVIGNS